MASSNGRSGQQLVSKRFTNIKIITVIAAILLAMAVLSYYYFISPAMPQNLFPVCTFKQYTGFDCAGCGGQRALHAMLHGNILQAISYNALYVFLAPFLLIMIFFSTRQFLTGQAVPQNFLYRTRFVIMLVVLLILFFILRNIPIWPFQYLHSDY